MPNIIDSIQISSSTFDVRDKSATTVVNLTQEQYDNLPSSAKTANVLYNITDATAGDLSQYWTSAQTQSAITQATSGKVETSAITSAVTSASTDSEIPTAKAVWEAASGGGTTYTGVSGITINQNNEIYYDGITKTWLTSNHDNRYAVYWFKGSNAKIWIDDNVPTGNMHWLRKQFSFGTNQMNDSTIGAAFGERNDLHGTHVAAFGEYNKTNNKSEFASGRYNVSSSASTTFGDSGNTLFSVGNGTSASARHNAFEIRQNGDIYLTKDGQDVKLQDQLGGGGGGITSGEVQSMIDESISGKTDESAFTAHTEDTTIHVSSSEKNTWNNKSDFSGDYNDLTNKPTIPTVPTNVSDFTNDAGYITSNDISGKTNQSDFTAHTANTTVHVTSAEKTTWNAKSDFSGDYNDLTNKLSAGTNITIVDNVISAEGGSITIDPSLDSGSTNAVANSAITTALNNKQIYNSSGYFYDVTTSYQNSGGKNTDYIRFKAYKNDGSTTNVTKLYFPRINGNKLVNLGAYYTDFQLLETSAITSAISSSSTDSQVPSAKAVNDKLGGLSLVKLTQAEYDALATKDSNTLYVING